MRLTSTLAAALVLCAATATAEATAGGDKVLSGMSVIGNDEAPKSLVIVPWKSSELGDTLEASRALDNGRQPVDRDVFMRALDYYNIRSAPDSGSDLTAN